MERPLYTALWNDLSASKSMVFLSGPRQAGKTTLAKSVSGRFPASLYFNWDIREDRARLLKDPSFFTKLDNIGPGPALVILDEIHKYRKWKNYLKGAYDAHAERFHFLVLGSGRLAIYQKGGDSMAGRYFLFSLWPLTLAELAARRRSLEEFRRDPMGTPESSPDIEALWKKLSQISGFPEPYLSGSEDHYRRWSSAYAQQLIREDIRDATELKRLDDVEALSLLLPSRIGSPLSIESLSRDLEVSFNSVRSWIEVFERFFLCFRLQPWAGKVHRALKKQTKLYLFDYPQIESSSARFENMVALELRRAVSYWSEWGWGAFDLFYVRNRDGHEVDFLITERRKPWLLIEVKESEVDLAPALAKFQDQLRVPALQLVNRPGIARRFKRASLDVGILTASHWLAGLP
jgi:predicted AAA+ superfamily ATPase